jgi:hypothetical protein
MVGVCGVSVGSQFTLQGSGGQFALQGPGGRHFAIQATPAPTNAQNHHFFQTGRDLVVADR